MVMLVHIAPAKLEANIRRSGLRSEGKAGGVFAFPVLPSHTLTHQWTREIGKWKLEPLVGVYFRIPDSLPVLFGRYNQPHTECSAAEAVSAIRAAPDSRGYEIILRASVKAAAITRITPLRGVIGWRHMPDAHGRRPCGCPYCQRGERGGRKLRARYEAGEL